MSFFCYKLEKERDELLLKVDDLRFELAATNKVMQELRQQLQLYKASNALLQDALNK